MSCKYHHRVVDAQRIERADHTAHHNVAWVVYAKIDAAVGVYYRPDVDKCCQSALTEHERHQGGKGEGVG